MKKRTSFLLILALLFAYGVAFAKNTKPVEVENNASDPVPVIAVSEPMQHDLASGTFIVPTDRYLIIKYVSGHCQMNEGYDILRFYINTGLTENRMRNIFVPVYVGIHNSINRYAFSQRTYIYCPPGSEVTYGWETSNPVLTVNNLVISGDLVPIP